MRCRAPALEFVSPWTERHMRSARPRRRCALRWTSKPQLDRAHELTGVSCPTTLVCASRWTRRATCLSANEPGAGRVAPAAGVDAERAPQRCLLRLGVAVRRGGQAAGGCLTSSEPDAWHRRALDRPAGLTAVPVAERRFLRMRRGRLVRRGGLRAAMRWPVGDPVAAAPTWSESEIDPGGELVVRSRVRRLGSAWRSTAAAEPAGQRSADARAGRLEHRRSGRRSGLSAVSCSAGSFCLALDSAGGRSSAPLPPPVSLVVPPPRRDRRSWAPLRSGRS